LLSDVTDGQFCNAILVVRIDSTLGDPLVILLTMLKEQVVRKSSVVTMVVLDSYSMVSRKAFKCFLGLKGLLRRQTFHVVDVPNAGEVFNKDGGCAILFVGEHALELGYESDLGADHLFYGDTLTRLGCFKDGLGGFLGDLGHRTKQATGTTWGLYLG
jgi:hypothetical protein